MTRIVVTGAAGFIGHAVTRALLARGDAVTGIDNLNDYYSVQLKRDRLADLAQQSDAGFTFHHLDFADDTALDAALAALNFDAIVHLGAQAGVRYSLENPRAYVRANLVGHVNMLEVARASGTPMVYASSSSVYGGNTKMPFGVDDRVDHPVSLYAATKKADELMSETYAHLYRVPLTGLRFFTVYGPWGRPDMAPWLFTRAILAGAPFTLCGLPTSRRVPKSVAATLTGLRFASKGTQ
jgi:UDP-glucuronate 4-epimerase